MNQTKYVPRFARIFASCMSLTFIFSSLCLDTQALNPPWWETRGVMDPLKPSDDYALINQGQFKQIVKGAYEEMKSRFPMWITPDLENKVNSLPGGDDYLPLNLGQMKFTTQPFYDILLSKGLVPGYPWPSNGTDDDVAVNIGCVKNAFNFLYPDNQDTDGDSLPDYYEMANGLNPLVNDVNLDKDGDGVSNKQDADPDQSSVGMLTITIETPAPDTVY